MPSQIDPTRFADGQPVSKAELRAALGSAKVELEHGGYFRAAAFTIERTVQDKLLEVLTVRDFGAIGDAVSDDSIAFMSALASSAVASVPPGIYRIGNNLSVAADQTLFLSAGAVVTLDAGVVLSVEGTLFHHGQGIGGNGVASAAADGRIVDVAQANYGSSQSSALIAADTIADLCRLRPTAHAVVQVLGYTAPGDGGGGLFRYSGGGEPTDGCRVFAYEGDLSSPQTVTQPHAWFNAITRPLGHSNIAFGTFALTFANGLVVTDLDMHGHRMNSSATRTPYLDHASGKLGSPSRTIQAVYSYAAARAPGNVTMIYRHVTNVRRWVRVVGDALDVRMAGAQPDNNAYNQICWALESAKRSGIKRVSLGGKSYAYRGTIELFDGCNLIDGTLKVVADDAIKPMRTDYDYEEPNAVFGFEYPLITIEDNAPNGVALYRIELDGNYKGNEASCLPANRLIYPGWANNLQNTPIWGGFMPYNHGGRIIPEGQTIVVQDCHFHGFGSNCALGHGNQTWFVRNLRLGNSVRNHLSYSVKGEVDGLTLYGFCWATALKTEHCHIRGLRLESIIDTPYETPSGGGLISYEGLDWGDGSPAVAHRWKHIGLSITDFYIDWSRPATIDVAGLPISTTSRNNFVSGVGNHLLLQNGVVMGALDMDVALLQHLGNGSETGLAHRWVIRDMSLFSRGYMVYVTGNGRLYPASVSIENISFMAQRGYLSPDLWTPAPRAPGSAPFLQVIQTNRADPAARKNKRLNVRGVVLENPVDEVISLDVVGTGVWDTNICKPLDIVFEGCTLRCRANSGLVSGPSSQATLTGFTIDEAPDKFRIYFDTCELSIGVDAYWSNHQTLFNCSRFRNCYDQAGRVSEQRGTFTKTLVADDVTNGYLDVTTNLFWMAEDIQIVSRSVAALARIVDWEMRKSDGSPIQQWNNFSTEHTRPRIRVQLAAPLVGETVKFDWRAAVRPF